MPKTLDQTMQDLIAAEATMNADAGTVSLIEAGISTATAPLAPAQAILKSDKAAFNAGCDAVSAAALAAKVPEDDTTAAPDPTAATDTTVATTGVSTVS